MEIAGTIMLQPGQGSTLFNIAPTAIIGLQDLAATKIIQPGSRVGYRYLFVGDNSKIAQFQEWLNPQLDSSQRVVSVFDEVPEGANHAEIHVWSSAGCGAVWTVSGVDPDHAGQVGHRTDHTVRISELFADIGMFNACGNRDNQFVFAQRRHHWCNLFAD